MTKLNLQRWLRAGALAIAAALSACSGGNEGDKAAQTAASAAAREGQRHAAAVAVINGLGSEIERFQNDYYRRFDPDRGPSGREEPGRLEGIGPEEMRRQDLAALAAVLVEGAGAGALDTTGLRLVKSIEALLPKAGEAATYYSSGQYQDDRFAKGKAMHGPLVAAFREYEAAYEPFAAVVSNIGDERQQRELDKLKAEGKLLQHDMLIVQRTARALIRQANALPDKPDLAAVERFRASEEAFSKAYAALKATATPERASAELGDDGLSRVKAYYSFCDGIQWKARDGLREFAAARKQAPDAGALARALTDSFNGLVLSYNRLLNLG